MNFKTTSTGQVTWFGRRQYSGARSTPARAAHEVRVPLRRHSRHATRNLQLESPVFGWAINVSESGLCLESLSELVIGGEYVFRLRYGTRFLNLPGQVVWSSFDRTEMTRKGVVKVYQTGIELAPETEEAWLETVEKLTGATLRA
jgi:hypothetical protein